MPSRDPVRVVCAGVAVIDYVFAIERPSWGRKARATAFTAVVGGCAANGSVAIARLGGQSRLVTSLGGPEGGDHIGDEILAWLAREHVEPDLQPLLANRRGQRGVIDDLARRALTILEGGGR